MGLMEREVMVKVRVVMAMFESMKSGSSLLLLTMSVRGTKDEQRDDLTKLDRKRWSWLLWHLLFPMVLKWS